MLDVLLGSMLGSCLGEKENSTCSTSEKQGDYLEDMLAKVIFGKEGVPPKESADATKTTASTENKEEVKESASELLAKAVANLVSDGKVKFTDVVKESEKEVSPSVKDFIESLQSLLDDPCEDTCECSHTDCGFGECTDFGELSDADLDLDSLDFGFDDEDDECMCGCMGFDCDDDYDDEEISQDDELFMNFDTITLSELDFLAKTLVRSHRNVVAQQLLLYVDTHFEKEIVQLVGSEKPSDMKTIEKYRKDAFGVFSKLMKPLEAPLGEHQDTHYLDLSTLTVKEFYTYVAVLPQALSDELGEQFKLQFETPIEIDVADTESDMSEEELAKKESEKEKETKADKEKAMQIYFSLYGKDNQKPTKG